MLDTDKKLRIHGFRRVASAKSCRTARDADRELLDAYAAGVNFALAERGRAAVGVSRCCVAQPAPWRVEDSVLVAFSMYLNLNDSTGEEELARAQLRAVLPRQLFAFLHPLGTEWDAPVVGRDVARARRFQAAKSSTCVSGARTSCAAEAPRSAAATSGNEPFVGSNSWAVAGTHAHDGAALLANDMHLELAAAARLVPRAADRRVRDGERRAISSASRCPGCRC